MAGWEREQLCSPHLCCVCRSYIGDVCVLEDMTTHLPVIEIRIVECRGRAGCYDHIHSAPVRYCTLRVFSCGLYFLVLWAISDKCRRTTGKLKGDLEVCKLSAFILSFSAFNFFFSLVNAPLLLHINIPGSHCPALELGELVTFLVLLLIDLPCWKACFHMVLVYHPWSSLADDGIDVRLRGIKIKSSRQRDLGLSADMFQLPNLVRYPRLEGTDPDLLYRRAVLIQRYCMERGRQVGWRCLQGLVPSPARVWLEAVKLCDSPRDRHPGPWRKQQSHLGTMWALWGNSPTFSEEFCSSGSVSCVSQAQHICAVLGAGAYRVPCKGCKVPAVPREWEFSTKGSRM